MMPRPTTKIQPFPRVTFGVCTRRSRMWAQRIAACLGALLWLLCMGQPAAGQVPTPTPTPASVLVPTRAPTATRAVFVIWLSPTPSPAPSPVPTHGPDSETDGRTPVRIYGIRPVTPTSSLTLTPSSTPTVTATQTNTPSPGGLGVLSGTPVPTVTRSLDPSAASPLIPTPAPAAETPVLQTADGQLITAPGVGLNQVGELPSFAPPVSLDGEYTVQDGDTLWRVAIEMGLDLDATICAVAPDFALDQPLVIGAVLQAPPLGTLCHQVQKGETPLSIATTYDVPVATLVAEGWNRIAPDALEVPLPAATYVRVPLGNREQNAEESDSFLAFMLEQPVTLSPYVVHATGGARTQRPQEPVPANWPYGSGQFEWPAYGWLSNGYRQDHRAIDIAAQPGTFVTAADRGVVIRAGWNSQGYGRFVVIDHNIDYITLYAHLDQVLVAEGDVVGKGQILGSVGSTGNSTGAHLHFEIRDFGRRTNPIEYLMR